MGHFLGKGQQAGPGTGSNHQYPVNLLTSLFAQSSMTHGSISSLSQYQYHKEGGYLGDSGDFFDHFIVEE